MKPLFSPSANSLYWLALATLAAAAVSLPVIPIAWARTPYATAEQEPEPQPVKFDHRHHVRDDGIDCLYCHRGAESSPFAGVPATSVCMGCHDQIWTKSPELAAVRTSWFAGEPLRWRRVSRLPDFVFFDHSVHVTHGVGCASCHGRVDQMAEVYATAPLTMRWCLDCHRDPAQHIRPLDRITDMEWTPGPPEEQRARAASLGVRSITDCSGCHR